MATPSGQLRVLTLNEGENLGTKLFRLEKGWILNFVLGPSLADKNVRVFTNHPQDSRSGPNRQLYHELKWQNLTGRKFDIYDNFAEVHMVLAGSFNYFFTTDGSDSPENANGKGYFLVDPALFIGKDDDRLPLDSITCQTYLSKLLGPLPEWLGRLRVAKETGYNMIHFTPIQPLGESNSAYCLTDQLGLNPIFNSGDHIYANKDVASLVQTIKDDWSVLSLTDLVFNHTANESPWIEQHPECVYNLINSPHLKPAYLLDRILWHFSEEVADDLWSHKGLPAQMTKESHLEAMRRILLEDVLPNHRIHEYYMLDIAKTINQFRYSIEGGELMEDDREHKALEILPDPLYRRFHATIDMATARRIYYHNQYKGMSDEDHVRNACDRLVEVLESLNQKKYAEIAIHLQCAVGNVVANAKYRFIDLHGLRVDRVTYKEPIMFNYFTLPKQKMTVAQEESAMHTEAGAFCMAHNGWVMNDDPLRNFAEPGSNIYLRRELIPWGDSVKLRYGDSPAVCPYLWEHMGKYAAEMARIFHGVRLDNCHSTPIHVAEYMLDEARKVRPNLYVIAELFTSSEQNDNLFINRLGLTSLIREGLNAWDAHELGRLIHRYGGYPVGSFLQPAARPLMPTSAHAIFFDQTHDNPSPVEKRTAFDSFASGALIAMACCASGSNRGCDELVPHHINVVTESRLYQSWSDEEEKAAYGFITRNTGIVLGKKALNLLHYELGRTGFTQIYVDKIDKNVVAITRHNPTSHQSIILVARTVYTTYDDSYVHIPSLCVPGVVDEIILEGFTVHKNRSAVFDVDPTFVNGLPGYAMTLREHIKITDSGMVEPKWVGDNKVVQEVEFTNFPPGSVIAFRVSLNSDIKNAILHIRQWLAMFGYKMRTYSGRNLKEISGTDLESIIVKMSLTDINRVLYRCDEEERDDGKGFGAYNVPGYGDLTYCGIEGTMSILCKTRANNDLGHPLCENVRNGDWLAQYTANRLLPHPGTQALGKWLEKAFKELSNVPRYLVPCYFDAIITGVYAVVEEVAWAKLSEFIHNGSSFVRALGMGSVQFCGIVRSAPLPILSPDLAPPQPPFVESGGRKEQACVTMSAGLPHFCSGYFRSWGRDTFISLPGLLLLTGRYAEARFIILGYAGCLRHGLLPNLLGGGAGARYNCRDALWWWLHCVQLYCSQAPNGVSILKDKVSRLYPTDDSQMESPGAFDQPLYDVIQEALQKHAEGTRFRERNAGYEIDREMTDEGFNNVIGINWDTGFVYGGNAHNCGTWMDKMGSSERGGNKGKPATPRDGSAVELVGLCASAVRWLSEMSDKGTYPYGGVQRVSDGQRVAVSFHAWHKTIMDNFEKHFWIDTSPNAGEVKSHLINRRGIYKDSFGASHEWADYQLRCNFPIAMVVAPELFTSRNAMTALGHVHDSLLGPLGMKTLDPSDWLYRGNYNNDLDTEDGTVSKGFNYHNGPEWLWPVGFFLRARLHFASALDKQSPGLLLETINDVKHVLANHNVHIHTSNWKSLPELTNENGKECAGSCAAQAWSVSCILEVLHDLEVLYDLERQ